MVAKASGRGTPSLWMERKAMSVEVLKGLGDDVIQNPIRVGARVGVRVRVRVRGKV